MRKIVFALTIALVVSGLVHRPTAPTKKDITVNGFSLHNLGRKAISMAGTQDLHAQGGMSCGDYQDAIARNGGESGPIYCAISFGNGIGVWEYWYNLQGNSGTFTCLDGGC